MKTRSLRKFAWVFFALILAATTVLAQGRGRGYSQVQNNQNQSCLTQIAGLSEEQVANIQKLEASHQERMAELRTQRRSTNDAIEKSEVRTAMLQNVEAHRNSVKLLLTDEQQKQFDQLQSTAYQNKSNLKQGRGKRNANFRGNSNSGKQNGTCRANNSASGNGRGNQNWSQPRNNCIRNNN